MVTQNINQLNGRSKYLNDLVKAKSSSQEAEKIKESIYKIRDKLNHNQSSMMVVKTREMIEKDEKDISKN